MTSSRGDAPVDRGVLADLVLNFSGLPLAEAKELIEGQPVLLTDDAD